MHVTAIWGLPWQIAVAALGIFDCGRHGHWGAHLVAQAQIIQASTASGCAEQFATAWDDSRQQLKLVVATSAACLSIDFPSARPCAPAEITLQMSGRGRFILADRTTAIFLCLIEWFDLAFE